MLKFESIPYKKAKKEGIFNSSDFANHLIIITSPLYDLNVTVGLDVQVTHPASANYDGPDHLSLY